MICCRLISKSTSVANQYRPKAEICALSAGRINSYFDCNSADQETPNPTIAQGDLQKRAFECGHRDLVHYGLASVWSQLRNNLECSTVPEEHGRDLLGRFGTLPRHRRAELERSHQRLRKRHMTCKEDSYACMSGGTQNLSHPLGDFLTARNLAHDSNLHVVNDQRRVRWSDDFSQGLRYK